MRSAARLAREAKPAAIVALLLLFGGCASVAPAGDIGVLSDRLFCGRSIPAGGTVSDPEWETFLRDVVTPRFPDGFTVHRGRGQWRGETGITAEEVMILEVLHPYSAETDRLMREIAEEYRVRFGQEAVLRVTMPARFELVD